MPSDHEVGTKEPLRLFNIILQRQEGQYGVGKWEVFNVREEFSARKMRCKHKYLNPSLGRFYSPSTLKVANWVDKIQGHNVTDYIRRIHIPYVLSLLFAITPGQKRSDSLQP